MRTAIFIHDDLVAVWMVLGASICRNALVSASEKGVVQGPENAPSLRPYLWNPEAVFGQTNAQID